LRTSSLRRLKKRARLQPVKQPSVGRSSIIARMADNSKKGSQFWVNGVVAVRDHRPYVQVSTENGLVAQFSISEARQVAMDLFQMAARTEADAMILKFFKKSEFPDGAGSALMSEFRDFRAELDSEVATRSEEDDSAG